MGAASFETLLHHRSTQALNVRIDIALVTATGRLRLLRNRRTLYQHTFLAFSEDNLLRGLRFECGEPEAAVESNRCLIIPIDTQCDCRGVFGRDGPCDELLAKLPPKPPPRREGETMILPR